MGRKLRLVASLASLGVLASTAAPAQDAAQSLSLRNTFRIGDSGVHCTAQSTPTDPRLQSMFDRGYRLTCRDAAGAVGSLVALRDPVAIADLPSAIAPATACEAPEDAEIEGIGRVEKLTCSAPGSGVRYRRYRTESRGEVFLVEGLAGYDPALRIALASVVNDRPMPGLIEVAQTEVSDAAAFARVQAGTLNDFDARNEAYVRNNSGRFAEAAQFFENVAGRSDLRTRTRAEALANQALQQSNLGNFVAAESMFREAQDAIPANDPVTPRLVRNYRAINGLNQKNPEFAIFILEQPMAEVTSATAELTIEENVIESPLAAQINRENLALQRLGGVDLALSPIERAELLDAQAVAINGFALRRLGRLEEANTTLLEADKRIARVRDGQVASARWLRSEIALERALIAEAEGRSEDALGAYDRSILNIARSFPESPALLATHARKAGFLLRSGREDEALALYKQIVDRSANVSDSAASLRDLMIPYFTSLAERGTSEAAAELFAATRLLERPGIAQTQAVLARQLSEGDDEASALFRLSLVRGREIARTEARADRLAATPEPTPDVVAALESARESLDYLRREQTRLLAELAQFPQYRSLSPEAPGLADIQQQLGASEAYYKLVTIGDELFALWITQGEAGSFKLAGDLRDLEDDVIAIRDSIVVIEGGQTAVYPFDVERSAALYGKLLGPVEERLETVEHLIFEPDGPMLQLPPQVLVTEQAGVDDYLARLEADPEADPYDFRGIEWLGKKLSVSIAVSPRGFLDIRNVAPSQASKAYIGLGSNALPPPAMAEGTGMFAESCHWPIGTWRDPIAPDELYFARSKFGADSGAIVTGDAFSDTALMENGGLDQYRIVHFATHGLVSAPAPGCTARPALVTSFGSEGSDGLLTFREIFDLKLDADVVILSACDTAGMATVSASREAGVTTGGNYALDGLVRAFVGAGARTVVASHWPVPDDFDATQRLMEGVVGAPAGVGLTYSLAEAQHRLMDEADTSHPFYWAAFIVVGDGTKPLRGG